MIILSSYEFENGSIYGEMTRNGQVRCFSRKHWRALNVNLLSMAKVLNQNVNAPKVYKKKLSGTGQIKLRLA